MHVWLCSLCMCVCHLCMCGCVAYACVCHIYECVVVLFMHDITNTSWRLGTEPHTYSMHTHAFYAYTHIPCTHIPCIRTHSMHTHMFHAYTHIPCIHTYSDPAAYTHMAIQLHRGGWILSHTYSTHTHVFQSGEIYTPTHACLHYIRTYTHIHIARVCTLHLYIHTYIFVHANACSQVFFRW
jgi:hypothetical protein